MPVVSQIVPDVGAVPVESKVAEATALQTALAASKLRLFKAGSASVTPEATKEMLEAAECDFDGYPAGGIAIATWGDPFVDPGTGTVLLAAPSKQFNYVDAAAVANDVGGWFLEDSTGVLRACAEFEDPITMNDNLDAIVLQIALRV